MRHNWLDCRGNSLPAGGTLTRYKRRNVGVVVVSVSQAFDHRGFANITGFGEGGILSSSRAYTRADVYSLKRTLSISTKRLVMP